MHSALIVVAVIAALAVPLLLVMFYGMAEIKHLVIHEVDLTKVGDGTHTGSYHKGRWTYDVEVVVRDHRIVSVKNTNERMNAVADWNTQAERSIVEKQAVGLDVVSGATVNSKAFGKAVELALNRTRTAQR